MKVGGRGKFVVGKKAADRLLLLPLRVAALTAPSAVAKGLLDCQQTLLAFVVDYRQPGSEELIKL